MNPRRRYKSLASTMRFGVPAAALLLALCHPRLPQTARAQLHGAAQG
jgi:hypothetical protein